MQAINPTLLMGRRTGEVRTAAVYRHSNSSGAVSVLQLHAFTEPAGGHRLSPWVAAAGSLTRQVLHQPVHDGAMLVRPAVTIAFTSCC